MKHLIILAMTLTLCAAAAADDAVDRDNVDLVLQVMDDYENFDQNPRIEEMKERLTELVRQVRLANTARVTKAETVCVEAATRIGDDYEESKEVLLGR